LAGRFKIEGKRVPKRGSIKAYRNAWEAKEKGVSLYGTKINHTRSKKPERQSRKDTGPGVQKIQRTEVRHCLAVGKGADQRDGKGVCGKKRESRSKCQKEVPGTTTTRKAPSGDLRSKAKMEKRESDSRHIMQTRKKT